jgi:hypothetical protein
MARRDKQDEARSSDLQEPESSKSWLLSTVEQAQETASVATDRIKNLTRNVAEQQKRAGADQIGGVADAMEAAAGTLEGQMPLAAGYIEDVAKQLDTMASALRERSVDDMLGNVADFARKQPALFFGGAVAAGFALSRVAKSSANRGS